MTAHIEAKYEDISKIVLMPGDPKRAEFIALNYLKDARLVNQVRGMYAYTGLYKGKKVTVMASGMGSASIGIYAYELYKFYDVSSIIRIGTCGSYVENLNIYDLALVTSSYSDSSFAYVTSGYKGNTIEADSSLNEAILNTANSKNVNISNIKVYSSDVFYKINDNYLDIVKSENVSACEMESFALFHLAKILNKKASAILTVSNSFVTGEETTSEEREKSLKDMIELALDSTLNI